MLPSITRKRFLQASAALLGAPLLGSQFGCDTGMPAGADTGAPGTDTGTPGTDTGTPGTDGGATDAGGTDAPAPEDGGTTSACSGDVIVADISNNHDHALEIPVADIVAGVERQYVTGGTTGHCHVVTLTAAHFAMLRAGETVRVVSCNNTEHEYALSCARSVTAGNPAPTCGASDEGRSPEACTGNTFTP